MILQNLIFEPLTEAHFALLHRWLNAPHVVAHWGSKISVEAVQAKYRDKVCSDWQQAFIVHENHLPFGYIQSYRAAKVGNGWWPNEPESTVGIDLFIGEPGFLGRGLGPLMVREFSDWLLAQPENKRVIADPKSEHLGAIQCCRRAGFSEVGVIDTPDGPALLMEKTAR